MTAEREFDQDANVRDVIVRLLRSTLPADMRAAAPELAERVLKHPDVAAHAGKRWGELSEGEGNIIAREAGAVARDVEIRSASAVGSGGEHLQ